MPLTELQSRILDEGITVWFANHGGASASQIAEALSVSHEEALKAVEELAQLGHGTLNRDVTLVELSFDPANPENGITQRPFTTNIFFPSKRVLRQAFYASGKPAEHLPEYVVRLHLGTQQIALIFFSEEVLSRYFAHPELYDINDSLAGGEVSSRGDDIDDRYLYVRYGKCRLRDGRIAVTAICKDLADMGVSEQRYWHSCELPGADLERSDPNFQAFLGRTYEGSFVDYPDPISDLISAMQSLNSFLSPGALFTRLENVHLRTPVERTYKSFCDCSSELYKLIGPDALSQSIMKKLLQQKMGLSAADFVHQQSKRPLSSIQLLDLLEQQLKLPGSLSAVIRKVSALRIDADHKVLGRDEKPSTYSEQFAALSREAMAAVDELARALAPPSE
jgi:hypothetical protein